MLAESEKALNTCRENLGRLVWRLIRVVPEEGEVMWKGRRMGSLIGVTLVGKQGSKMNGL